LESTATLVDILGAGALLLWGLRMVKTGVSRAFGARLRVWVGRSTANRFLSFTVGLIATLALQSSTATAVMASSFAARELMSGAMAQGVMLGANVGTSLVTGLLALNLHWLAPLFLLAGFATFKLGPESRGKGIGRALLGLGLMLLSLRLLGEATDPLRASHTMQLILGGLAGAPIFGMLLAGGLAILASSSLAVVLLILSLASSGTMEPGLILVLVAGANFGGAIPPILATLGDGALGKRVTFSNFGVRGAGAILVLIAAEPLGAWLHTLAPTPSAFVVSAHIGFNIALAMLFMPLLTPISRLAKRLLPRETAAEDGPRFLDPASLDTPVVALSIAARETLRVGDIVLEMLEASLRALRSDDQKSCSAIADLDDRVDRLQEAVKIYLTRLHQDELEPAEVHRANEIISYVINLEHIGDIVDKSLAGLAARKIKNRVSFSAEGFAEIEQLFEKTIANMRIAQSIFMSRDVELARRLVAVKVDVRRLEHESAERHIERIRQRRAESLDTSTLHLDVLRDLKRINAHITSVAYPILDELGQLRESRLLPELQQPPLQAKTS
jgi:phosphate:Na+ symporter